MNLVVNGKETNITDGLIVNELLIQENVKMPNMLLVELNGQILNLRQPSSKMTTR